jgi:hypothetical protein
MCLILFSDLWTGTTCHFIVKDFFMLGFERTEDYEHSEKINATLVSKNIKSIFSLQRNALTLKC